MAEGGSFGATEESAATGVRREKRRDSRTEARRRAALTSPRGLSAQPPGRAGLGAEARASVRPQGEDWGWRREHSLKGASAPQLARRESGEKSGAAEKARDFFFPLCFLVREKRGFRAPPKRTSEMGASCGYQRGPHSNRGAEEKTERFPHRGSRRAALTSPRGLSAHPPGLAELGAEAQLRSDRRKRTGVGGVNTA